MAPSPRIDMVRIVTALACHPFFPPLIPLIPLIPDPSPLPKLQTANPQRPARGNTRLRARVGICR
jgi:hypothetical protein